MNPMRLVLLAVIVILAGAFFAFDLSRFFTLATLKAQYGEIAAYREAHPLTAAALYAAIYIVVTGLSLPGATVLTLAGGAVFGLLWGTLIVSFASTIGATLAFLAARFLFRDMVTARFGEKTRAIDAGMARDGAAYLFALRLVPLFPFFMINLVMGLTAIPAWRFFWVSQAGMLIGTLVYVNAGTQLARVESLSGILSPGLLLSLGLLGIFPLLARKGMDLYKARQVYAGWRKPRRFDRNLVVIGGGSAGLVAAYIAAALKAKVTLVEKHRMGGDCLNTGCVPSKALIRSARLLDQIRRAPEFGLRGATADFDFAAIMERVQRVIRQVAPHDSAERYEKLGVEVIHGEATLVSPWEIAIATAEGIRTLSTRAVVIAAGAAPYAPPIPGLAEVGYFDSDTVWNLRELPGRLLVLGGGPIGCELAQCFARFGSQVTLVEAAPRLLVREDPDASEALRRRFAEEGIDLRLEHTARSVLSENGEKILVAECQGREIRIPCDAILIGLGRAARTTGYGLEDLGIATTETRTIETNEFLQTRYPNIYACGDVAGRYQFTHTAAHQAWYASVNALLGHVTRFRADYRVIPCATFTEPEVARVGYNETEAAKAGIPFETSVYELSELDRAIADGETQGFVKVLTEPGRDRILGVTIVGAQASELIAEFVLAMKHAIGLEKLLGTIHIYPTWSEANKYTAGVWKRRHAPERLLRWLGRYHGWRRGGGSP